MHMIHCTHISLCLSNALSLCITLIIISFLPQFVWHCTEWEQYAFNALKVLDGQKECMVCWKVTPSSANWGYIAHKQFKFCYILKCLKQNKVQTVYKFDGNDIQYAYVIIFITNILRAKTVKIWSTVSEQLQDMQTGGVHLFIKCT